MKTHLFYITAIAFIVGYFKYCSKDVEYVKGKDTVRVVSIKDTVISYKPKVRIVRVPRYVEGQILYSEALRTSTDTIRLTDTIEVVADYATQKIYSDTLKNTYGYVVVNDTLQYNAIAARQAFWNLNIPETTKHIIEKRAQLYGGLNLTSRGGIGFGMAYKTKRDYLFSVDYNFGLQQQQMFITGKLPIKIFRK